LHPRIGIAGAGLIGGSIALRAARLGWKVAVFDTDPEHLRIALARLDAGRAAASLAELAGACDILVLAAPLDATLAQLAELSQRPIAGMRLIVDVASVKGPVARAGAALATFVPTHPIAGSERSGPAAADAGLFAGRTWTYDGARAPVASAEAVAFIEAMGGVPVALASDEHDRIVALTSHLPQIVSTALGTRLATSLDDDAVAELCGTGIRSMLRLAGSSWTVWRSVIRENAGPVAQEVRRLADILTGVAGALEAGASDTLGPDFARAAAAVARLHNSDER
jgi:prephenate dehydrogenase